MNGKRKKLQIQRCGLLQSKGWNIDSIHSLNTYSFHHGKETPAHTAVKLYLCQAIKDNSHSFATEVVHKERGRVDVMDIYEDGPGAYIYEVETNCDREDRVRKAKQYTDDFDADEITDVFVVDPTNAPEQVNECYDWCAEKVVG